MKKYYFLIIVALILGLVLTGCSLLSNVGQVPTNGQSGIAYLTKATEDAPFMTTLFAGQDIDVGTVSVWNDDEYLYVTYETTGGWKMTEIHLAVVTEFKNFPTNKAGNPKVGHFRYSEENIFTDTWEEIIKLSVIPVVAGQELFIAAHAVVADTSITKEEVVVSRLGIDAYGPLDHYASLESVDWGSLKSAVPTFVHSSWPWKTDPDGATWISTAYHTELPVANNSWRWFHDEINIQGYPFAGTVVSATADNAEEVYFNGVPVGSDGEIQGPFIDNQEWNTILDYSIIPQPGLNTLDFIVRNYAGSSNPESNPTGLIYKTTISYYPEESAWANGPRFTKPGNWATYFTYTVPLHQIEVLAVSSTPVPKNLVAGNYKFVVSGTAFAGDTIEFDAKYSKTHRIPDDTWTDAISGYSLGPEVLDLHVNGATVEWGDYNAEHIYEYEFSSLIDGTVTFCIYDTYPINNSGHLIVEIYEQP